MAQDYKSYQFTLSSVGGVISIPRQSMFWSSKPNKKPSLFTIVIQYNAVNLNGGVFGGVQPTIVGNINGAQPIINTQLVGQKVVPFVGGIYQAYGTEIEIGLDWYGTGPEEYTVSVHAFEDAPVYNVAENAIEDGGVGVTVLPFFVSGFMTDFAGDYRVFDPDNNTIQTFTLTVGQYINLNEAAAFIGCTSSLVGDIISYQFRRGYL